MIQSSFLLLVNLINPLTPDVPQCAHEGLIYLYRKVSASVYSDSIYIAGANIYSASVITGQKSICQCLQCMYTTIFNLYGYGNLTNVTWLASYTVCQLKSCPTTLVDSEHSLLSNPISVCVLNL